MHWRLNAPSFRSAANSLPRPAVLLTLMCLAFCIRVGFAHYTPTERTWVDSSAYHGIAANLLAGNGYSLDGLEPTRIRPPTYPAFLAVVYAVAGVRPYAAVVVQSLIGALTCLLAYLVGRRIFGDRAGLIAAGIVAVYPASIYYDTRILREGLCAFLVTLGLWLAILTRERPTSSNRYPVLYGVLVGLMTMCRPELLVPSSAISLIFLCPTKDIRRTLKQAMLVALPVLCLWIPWTVRNYVTFGSFSPITAGLGSVLWFGNRWAEIGGDSHTSNDRTELQARTQEMLKVPEAEIDRQFRSEALQDLSERPGWYATMVLRKMVMFWKDANGVKKTLPRIHPALGTVLNTLYYGLLLLAIVTVILSWGRNLWVAPMLGIILTYMMTYALLHVRNRYRVPILPLVFVLSAGGFWQLHDMAKMAIAEKLGLWREEGCQRASAPPAAVPPDPTESIEADQEAQ